MKKAISTPRNTPVQRDLITNLPSDILKQINTEVTKPRLIAYIVPVQFWNNRRETIKQGYELHPSYMTGHLIRHRLGSYPTLRTRKEINDTIRNLILTLRPSGYTQHNIGHGVIGLFATDFLLPHPVRPRDSPTKVRRKLSPTEVKKTLGVLSATSKGMRSTLFPKKRSPTGATPE